MSKKIEILEVESGVRAIAELLEKEAPKTCELMWACLETPMETEGIQAMWVGPELMFLMPEESQLGDPSNLPDENATAYPLPGDVIFKHFPPRATQQFYDDFRDKPIWDFYLIYAPDPIVGGMSTVWARIVEGLEDFARQCSKIREEGTKMFRVTRLEQAEGLSNPQARDPENRTITLELLESGASVKAELLEDRAPRTCKAIWKALRSPIETKALHGKWTGRTLEIDIPQDNRLFAADAIPLENATTTPTIGEILWQHVPAGRVRSIFDGLWNIVLAYGPEAVIRTPLGRQPANVWARVLDDNETFTKECAGMWFGEAQTVRISRHHA